MSSLSKAVPPKEAKLFRHNCCQAVRIPVEFELPGDRVLIHREGNKLIIEPMSQPTKLVELLAEWRQEQRLVLEDTLSATEDMRAKPEDIF
ncbi:antitoxin [Methylophilus sp. VKM B-3414]|uniref:antitoxin n=1 Tax=Methylophilus sp. VKM B-3414 TaxID=3076121 RepID=UPI0028C96792|nr:antitoxin [Methylophilus sp. VKM B-3414]MDT7850176.1 antitoxin [Methylophilus sp. VKM B-3414]